jgi:hypothetical protein
MIFTDPPYNLSTAVSALTDREIYGAAASLHEGLDAVSILMAAGVSVEITGAPAGGAATSARQSRSGFCGSRSNSDRLHVPIGISGIPTHQCSLWMRERSLRSRRASRVSHCAT